MILRSNKVEKKLSKFIKEDDIFFQNFVVDMEINTIYLAIDGTRRYFISEVGIDYRDPDFFSKYFEFSIAKMVELLKLVFDHGITNCIVLLMDHTAFERDKDYLENAVKLGIEPIIDHSHFVEFYQQYNISPVFGGYNEIYRELGFDDLYSKIEKYNGKDITSDHTLMFYTGPIAEFDILLYQPEIASSRDRDETHQMIFEYLYPVQVPEIDISIYYGYPREKIKPDLLSRDSVNFFTENPSLGLTREQFRKILFYYSHTKNDIKDNYLKYRVEEVNSKNGKDNQLLAEKSYQIL